MNTAEQHWFNEDVRDSHAIRHLFRDDDSWRTSRYINEYTGLSALRIRELCQIYPTLLISSPQGYKLTRLATHREITHCVQSLITRGQKIIERASQLAGTL